MFKIVRNPTISVPSAEAFNIKECNMLFTSEVYILKETKKKKKIRK